LSARCSHIHRIHTGASHALFMNCDYCGSDVHRHEPVFVQEDREFRRVDVGQFCNYSCLSAYIDEGGLAGGAEISSEDERP